MPPWIAWLCLDGHLDGCGDKLVDPPVALTALDDDAGDGAQASGGLEVVQPRGI